MARAKVAKIPGEKTEAEWQAEHDARTLIDARKIQQEPPRLARAKKAAQRIIAEHEKIVRSAKFLATARGRAGRQARRRA